MAELGNIGLNRKLIYQSVKRLVFTLTTADSGTANSISIADASAIANWQAKFNVYSHATDPSIKFVSTPIVREFTKEDTEPVFWEIEDYKVKMRNAQVDLNFSFLDVEPGILARLQTFEDATVAVYLITEDNKALGIKDGANLKPIPVKDGSLSIPNYSPRGYEEGSRSIATMRLNSGSDMNNIVAVDITDCNVYSDSDFYSLYDATATATNPATTGATFSIVLDDIDPSTPGTPTNVTGIVYTNVLVKKFGASSYVAVAATGNWTYGSGVYTLNEAIVFASGANLVRFEHPGYNIHEVTVTVS